MKRTFSAISAKLLCNTYMMGLQPSHPAYSHVSADQSGVSSKFATTSPTSRPLLEAAANGN